MNKYMKTISILMITVIVLLSILLYGGWGKSKTKNLFDDELSFLALDIMTKSFITMNNNLKVIERPESFDFVNTIQNLQLAFQEKYLIIKFKAESLGFKLTPAQIYNLLAQNLEVYKNDSLKSTDFISQEAAEKVLCMKFDFYDATKVFGINLKEVKVNDKNGKSIEPNYYLTKNGEVFVWPPYEFENEFYLNNYAKVVDLNGDLIGIEDTSKMFKDDFVVQINGLEIPVEEYLK